MLGNYLGTIAICGMVCEMLALLTFELTLMRQCNGNLDRPASQELEIFEKTRQDERIKLLRKKGLISEATAQRFHLPHHIRRQYLHFFSKAHDTIASDARKVWNATCALVAETMKFEFENGVAKVDPTLLRYLRQHDD